ncbi:hypothetical protein [Streptomyces murinus]|uniref:hypothetical protein n=1 Tax=Streptomyces murinus TaxID=33900 RepID=UPI0036E8CA78
MVMDRPRVSDPGSRTCIRHLVDLGYFEAVGDSEAAVRSACLMREGVRGAIETAVDDLAPAERAAVARFADLVDRHAAAADERGATGPAADAPRTT